MKSVPGHLKPIASARKRLQRMLLRLQSYLFDLIYVPGSRLDVADTLSRAPVSQFPVTEQSDLEMVCAVVDAQLTDRKITAVCQATAEDKTIQKVQQLIKEGCPSDKRGLPNQVVPFFIYGTNWSTRTA